MSGLWLIQSAAEQLAQARTPGPGTLLVPNVLDAAQKSHLRRDVLPLLGGEVSLLRGDGRIDPLDLRGDVPGCPP